jgi:hypothetical protein
MRSAGWPAWARPRSPYTPRTPGRYRLHDLIREHARALTGRLDPGDDQERACGRLMDYYQHAAARAEALLGRRARTAPTAGDAPGSRGPSGPACSPAWTRPPPPASTPASSR